MSGSDPTQPDDPLITLYPWLDGYSFAFRRTDASESGIALVLRHTVDLQSWTDIPIPVAAGTITDPTSGIEIIESEYAELPDLIEVLIPPSSPRRFLQLKASPAAP